MKELKKYRVWHKHQNTPKREPSTLTIVESTSSRIAKEIVLQQYPEHRIHSVFRISI